MKRKPHFIFRYYSSRGTDRHICVALKPGTSTKDALEMAKDWAERDTAGSACHEYTVTVKRVRKLPRPVWLSRWKKVCDQKQRITDRYNELRAMNNARDWSNE